MIDSARLLTSNELRLGRDVRDDKGRTEMVHMSHKLILQPAVRTLQIFKNFLIAVAPQSTKPSSISRTGHARAPYAPLVASCELSLIL